MKKGGKGTKPAYGDKPMDKTMPKGMGKGKMKKGKGK
jgi:hypothetical protein